MQYHSRIYVAGSASFLGCNLIHRLQSCGYRNLVADEPDLTDSHQVEKLFAQEQPEYVFVVAGETGGIQANRMRPADLMLDNLMCNTNVIHQALRHGVTKLMYVASSCIYPKHAPQPLRVESLMTGPLERTNEAYATAKLAGLKLVEAYRRQYGVKYINAIPANAFGPLDHFDDANGHVIPALIQRIHQAKEHNEPSVTLWGTGTPRREFIYVEDLADAGIHVMNHYDDFKPINIGSGLEYSILETAEAIAEVVGYQGQLLTDPSKPDGMPRKVLDSSRLIELGWQPNMDFHTALAKTYEWYRNHALTEERTHARAAL